LEVGQILNDVSFVDVGVVNLTYAGDVLPVQGFGYLIPSSEPSDILGVVFDSCALPEQDASSGKPITRVTAMMGGYMFRDKFGDPDKVAPEKLKAIAVESIKRHLAVADAPISSRVTIQQKCIPQYTVGHRERLMELMEVINEKYHGKLSLVGSSYVGVGVNDCIRGAKDVASALSAGNPVTGLERAI
jgi:oxygen-dependent protoporphyrinogen oxidase